MDVKRFLLLLISPLSLCGITSANCPRSDYTGTNGTVASPGLNTDQSYGDNLNCTYNIRVPVGRRVILEFKKLEVLGTMPNCTEDSLEIKVGCDQTSIGKFCSCSELSMPNKIYSLDNCITLVFKTDGSKKGAGFEAQYTSIDNNTRLDSSTKCSTKFLGSSSGTIFTPNWPLPYPPTADCSWNFSIPAEKIIRLFFTSFVLEGVRGCEPDRQFDTDDIRVDVTNTTGGNLDIIPRVCAKLDLEPFYTIPQIIKAVRVRFSSTDQIEKSGVVAGYASYKTDTLGSQSPGCKDIQSNEPTPTPTTNYVPTRATDTLGSQSPGCKDIQSNEPTATPTTNYVPTRATGSKTLATFLFVVFGTLAILVLQ